MVHGLFVPKYWYMLGTPCATPDINGFFRGSSRLYGTISILTRWATCTLPAPWCLPGGSVGSHVPARWDSCAGTRVTGSLARGARGAKGSGCDSPACGASPGTGCTPPPPPPGRASPPPKRTVPDQGQTLWRAGVATMFRRLMCVGLACPQRCYKSTRKKHMSGYTHPGKYPF